MSAIVLPRVRNGHTGYRHLNALITAIETALNSTFTGVLPIATSDVTNLDADLALKAPLANPTFTGTATAAALTATGLLTATGGLVAGVQALSGAGAVDVVTLTTRLTTTGASQALTLANGTAGQIKSIVHEVDGGSAVLTPTTKTGFSTITFTNVGDSVLLQYFATRGWMILALNGAVAG